MHKLTRADFPANTIRKPESMFTTTIAGKNCRIFAEGRADYILIQPTGEHESDSLALEYSLIKSSSNKSPALAAFAVDDWNRELSPWSARAAFGDEPFGDGAAATLDYITGGLLTSLGGSIDISPDAKLILGGYSLAGLFCLWCAYKTDLFSAVAACSPSVWIDGWMDFAEGTASLVQNIYLSLGTKEHRTRNPMLKTVRDSIVRQHEYLCSSGVNAHLEFNPGNHFQDNAARLAKGFLWCIDNC